MNSASTSDSRIDSAEMETEIPSVKSIFLASIERVVLENLNNPSLRAIHISEALNLSKSTINRRLKQYKGIAINHFIQEVRLRKAVKLLSLGYKVQDVSSRVGYNSPSYFAQTFKAHFQTPPSRLKQS